MIKPTDSVFYKCMYFMSNALARKMEKLAQESLDEIGLAPSHAYLLAIVLEEPGVQPSALSDNLQLQPSTVTRLLEKLEEKKLVIRTSEGKITNVYATPKGKEIGPKLKECLDEFHNNYVTILGKEESTKLVQAMGKLADKLHD